ncbi:MAG: GAF domain-containing protein [Bacteroidales bacterium]|nr:GAF domain-containing protein [Bacteroidales bacterium]
MSEDLIIKGSNKKELYENLIPQIKSLVEGEPDSIANMANISACLKDTFQFWWVGFYRVVGDELVLGPFQGPLACTRIKKGKGVCGSAWQKAETIVVPDVDAFPGHIACSSLSRSEIVVPIIKNGEVVAVLDIDSEKLNTFDDVDRKYLEELVLCLV